MEASLSRLVRDSREFFREYRSSDLVRENEELTRELAGLKKRLDGLEQRATKLTAENSSLKATLREQVLDEKMNLINGSRHKLDTYFKSQASGRENRLTALEKSTRRRTEELGRRAERELASGGREFKERLDQFTREAEDRIKQLREQLLREEESVLAEAKAGFLALAEEGVSEEVLRERARQNELELKIGLGVANKIGIALILFGVAAAFRYTYVTWFSDHLKGIVFFLLGALMLTAGEWSYRKGKRVFSTGLLGGGLAVLYSSVFYSHFLLDIISITGATALAAAVTAVAVVLSLRYNSRTICSLGLAGGYLPLASYIVSAGLGRVDFNAAMGYLFVLNLAVVLVSYHKRWEVVRYLSFLFNVPSQVYLLNTLEGEPAGVLLAILTFFIYLAVTLAYPLRHRLSLRPADIVLLGLNTLYSSVLLYSVLAEAGLTDFRGALALFFCLSYTGLGLFANKKMPKETAAAALFYATALAFAVLAVPFQFGARWLSLGWLAEGTALIMFGFRSRLRKMELAGWGILLFSLIAFYLFDFEGVLFRTGDWQFHLKYFFVTAGMLAVLFVYLTGGKQGLEGPAGPFTDYFKYFVLANLWVYLLFSADSLYRHYVPGHYHYSLYRGLLASLVTFATGLFITGLPLLYDRVVRIMGAVLFGAGCLITFYLNLAWPALNPYATEQVAADYLALAVLIAFNLLVLLAVRRILLALIAARSLSFEHYPLGMGVYLLGTVSVFLLSQFSISAASLTFSLAWLVLAAAYVFYGMRQRSAYIRRFGLGLSLLGTGKLFIFDLSFLDTLGKILAYFCFGLILVGISYLYQKMERGGTGVSS
jgi:uncharacterized membrane protein